MFGGIYARFPFGKPDEGLILAYWQNSLTFQHGPEPLPPVPPVVIFFSEFAKEVRSFRPKKESNVIAHEIPWPRRSFASAPEMEERTRFACSVIEAAQKSKTVVMLLDDCGEGAALFTACFYLMNKNRDTLEDLLAHFLVSKTYLEHQGTSLHVPDLLRLEAIVLGKNSIPALSLEVVMKVAQFKTKALQERHDSYVQSLTRY